MSFQEEKTIKIITYVTINFLLKAILISNKSLSQLTLSLLLISYALSQLHTSCFKYNFLFFLSHIVSFSPSSALLLSSYNVSSKEKANNIDSFSLWKKKHKHKHTEAKMKMNEDWGGGGGLFANNRLILLLGHSLYWLDSTFSSLFFPLSISI